jgi:hypothetical protein
VERPGLSPEVAGRAFEAFQHNQGRWQGHGLGIDELALALLSAWQGRTLLAQSVLDVRPLRRRSPTSTPTPRPPSPLTGTPGDRVGVGRLRRGVLDRSGTDGAPAQVGRVEKGMFGRSLRVA